MPQTEYALFIGAEKETVLTEFIATSTFFLIVSTSQTSDTSTAVEHHIKKTVDEIEGKNPQDLASFKTILDTQLLQKLKKDTDGAAAGLIVNSILYLVTYGQGTILLKRGDKLAQIVSGGQDASGIINENDMYVFTNNTFIGLIDNAVLSEKITIHPKETVEMVTPIAKMNDDTGAIALFLHCAMRAEEETALMQTEDDTEIKEDEPIAEALFEQIPQTRVTFLNKYKQTVTGFFTKLSQYQNQTSKNKKLTLIAVFIIFIILIWSVVFGVKRRSDAQLIKDIQHSNEVIDQKIQEASDVAGLNIERSQILLQEAKNEFETIQKKAHGRDADQIKKIADKVTASENSIVKKEEKKAEVFYDLKLINNTAKASYLYKDKTAALLLNGSGKEAYVLDLEKKSIKTYKKDELQGATMGAIYNDVVIFYVPQKGFYKIDTDGKVSKVIEPDSEWGTLTAMTIYNGNLYILDTGKSDVYKYLVAEVGYSEKKSYFKDGQKITIPNNASLAIDASLYIATNKKVYKFVTGVRDSFNVQFPDSGTHIFDQVVADKDTNNVYLLDKTNSKVYVLSKTGEYEKQIQSDIFKNADGITVMDDAKSIYILVSDKIYSIAL